MRGIVGVYVECRVRGVFGVYVVWSTFHVFGVYVYGFIRCYGFMVYT